MKSFSQNFLPYFVLLLATFLGFVAATEQWYTAKDGSKYLIETDNKFNFLQAVDKCASHDLQLVILDNAEKNDKLVELLQSFSNKPRGMWIDLQDQFNTEKDLNRPFYSVATGKQTKFSSWRDKDPNNLDSNEHCVELEEQFGYKWNDINCQDTRHGYICEEHHLTTSHKKKLDIMSDLTKFTLANSMSDFKIQMNQIIAIDSLSRRNIKSLMNMWLNSAQAITSDQDIASFVKTTIATMRSIEQAQLSAEKVINRSLAEHSSRLESDSTFIDGVLSHH